MAIDKGTRAEILRLYYAEKWKTGTIADQLGVHHSTVDRVLSDAGVPRQERRHRRSKLDPFLPFIRQTLAVYPKLAASRLYEMARERGYGFGAFGDQFTWTPEAGFGLSDVGRDYSFGWRLDRRAWGGVIGSLELSFEARRRESANDNTKPEHEVGFRLKARF